MNRSTPNARIDDFSLHLDSRARVGTLCNARMRFLKASAHSFKLHHHFCNTFFAFMHPLPRNNAMPDFICMDPCRRTARMISK